MRNTALLIGTLLVGACSIDHIVVAALDQAAGANTGGASGGGAGSSGLNGSGAGELSSGGSPPQAGTASRAGTDPQGGMDRILLTSGGSNVTVWIGADAGATSEIVCACAGQQAQLCSSDGVTYTGSCEDDAGTCLAPIISCFHACPCLDDEPANADVVSWFPQDCAPMAQCSDGFFCMTFSNVTRGEQLCTSGSN